MVSQSHVPEGLITSHHEIFSSLICPCRGIRGLTFKPHNQKRFLTQLPSTSLIFSPQVRLGFFLSYHFLYYYTFKNTVKSIIHFIYDSKNIIIKEIEKGIRERNWVEIEPSLSYISLDLFNHLSYTGIPHPLNK